MDFFDRSGQFAIGSRLRLLSERLQTDARKINELYGSQLKPKWFPVFYLLMRDGPLPVTDIAGSIGQQHPAVVRMINDLAKAGLVTREEDPSDGRRRLVRLTEAGQRSAERMHETIPDVDAAVHEIAEECEHDLWAALAEWEAALDRRGLLPRTLDIRKVRTRGEVSIVPFRPADHQQAWHDLNEEWISHYFTMEETDYRSLRDPQGYILDRGGHILIAEWRGKPVGTCALIKMNHPRFDYELAKMSVSPKTQGLGIGYLLGEATLKLARELGAATVYLETNKVLTPAIRLYEKLGFTEVKGIVSPYARCDYQMKVSV